MSDPGEAGSLDLPYAPVQFPALRSLGPIGALGVILLFSAAVLGFLVWLIYLKPAAGTSADWVTHLPAVNASLNALSATFLVSGYRAVRRRRYVLHVRLMLAAVATSALFLISYVIYHNFHGDTKFSGTGPIRPVYFFILISHIILSGVAVPMILTTLYLALAGNMATHRRVSRYTLPVWLYASVTGVLIFAMLKLFSA